MKVMNVAQEVVKKEDVMDVAEKAVSKFQMLEKSKKKGGINDSYT